MDGPPDHVPLPDPDHRAAALLESLGAPSFPLEVADGWVNRVWLAPAHVVRLSSGRFRESFTHEARVLRLLPPDVPHARVVAHRRSGRREWLVLERVPGVTLARALRRRAPARRDPPRAAPRPRPGRLIPAGLADALASGGSIRDAYHAPPDRYTDLLAAAEEVPGIDPAVLREVGAFIAERMDAFAPEAGQEAPVHGDVHFGNIMLDGADGGRIGALLDFEGARSAPPDLELDTLLRITREPAIYDPRLAAVTARDLDGVSGWLGESYPALFAHPRLNQRLAVHEALWQASGLVPPW